MHSVVKTRMVLVAVMAPMMLAMVVADDEWGCEAA